MQKNGTYWGLSPICTIFASSYHECLCAHFLVGAALSSRQKGDEKVVQNSRTEPRLAVGYPKVYDGTPRGEVRG